MAIARVQAKTTANYENSGTFTSFQATLSSAATAGNLLVGIWAIDKNSGTVNAPSGWTRLGGGGQTSVSMLVAYKIAAGGETSATATWSTAQRGCSAVLAEYSGVDTANPIGPTHLPAYNDTERTSIELNPPAATADGAALAFIAIDSVETTDGSGFQPSAVGFTLVAVAHEGSANTGSPGASLSEDLTVAAGEDIAPTTFSWTTSESPWGMAVLLNAGGPAAPTVTHRVVGIPTGTAAYVSTRTANATSVRLKVGTDTAVTTGVVWGSAVTPSANGDSKLTVSGLTAGTRYYYRVAMTDADGVEHLDAQATVGTFKTAPTGEASFAFCFGSCTDASDSPSFAAMAAHDDDLFFHLGDLFYADGTGTSTSNIRSKIAAKLAAANHHELFATTASAYTPSDHDATANDSTAGSAPTAWANWLSVYNELWPTPTRPTTSGVYFTWTWGRVRFIQLDRRMFASSPSATDDSSKTALGSTQKQWLFDTVSAATEPVIVIVQEAARWISTAIAGEDDWSGYTTERDELKTFLVNSGKNVVMLGGDMHALAYDDGTNAGVPLFHAAPFTNGTSVKGGPYTGGTYPTSGSSTVVNQYGRVVVTDSGSSISLAFTGYSSDGTARISGTETFNVGQTVNAALSASGSLSATAAAGQSDDVLINGSGTLTNEVEIGSTAAVGLTASGALSTTTSTTLTVAAGLSAAGTLDATTEINGQTLPGYASATGTLSATVAPGATAAATIDAYGDLLSQSVPGQVVAGKLTAAGALTAVLPVWRDITVTVGPYSERAVTTAYRE